MNQFTIKDIENLSGIKAHTWRIWEQRYGIDLAQRRDSKHRFYNNDNLKQILRIAYLYHGGIKISRIAELNEAERKNLALEKLPKEDNYEFYIKELLEASIDLDEERFERSFNDAIGRMGIEDVILKVIYPFQYRIGVLWLTDHVIPAQEHFTSNIIRRKLSVSIDQLPYVKETDKRTIVLFTPEGEHHEIPIQFIYYLLRKNNNKVIYFGSNISLSSIKTYVKAADCGYIMFHLVTNLAGIPPQQYLQELSKEFPGKQMVISGPKVQEINEVPENARVLRSLEEILKFAKE